jgi:hypothetical protein
MNIAQCQIDEESVSSWMMPVRSVLTKQVQPQQTR